MKLFIIFTIKSGSVWYVVGRRSYHRSSGSCQSSYSPTTSHRPSHNPSSPENRNHPDRRKIRNFRVLQNIPIRQEQPKKSDLEQIGIGRPSFRQYITYKQKHTHRLWWSSHKHRLWWCSHKRNPMRVCFFSTTAIEKVEFRGDRHGRDLHVNIHIMASVLAATASMPGQDRMLQLRWATTVARSCQDVVVVMDGARRGRHVTPPPDKPPI
jgi:hypothetical protein